MLRKAVFLVSQLVLLLGLAGTINCGGGGSGSPSAVVLSYYDAVNEGDIKKAAELLGGEFEPSQIEGRWHTLKTGVVAGHIERVEIIHEEVYNDTVAWMGSSCPGSEARVHVRVTLDPSFQEPTVLRGVDMFSFLEVSEGYHLVVLWKLDRECAPQFEGKWKIVMFGPSELRHQGGYE